MNTILLATNKRLSKELVYCKLSALETMFIDPAYLAVHEP